MSVPGQKNQKPQLFLVSDSHSESLQRSKKAEKKPQLSFTPEKLAQQQAYSKVLKAEALSSTRGPTFREPSLMELAQKNACSKPHSQALASGSDSSVSHQKALQDLQDNLKSFQELHSRLRFMLMELEEFIAD